ncbi:MAG: conserved rane protein of unknown function [Enterovirga sp.]|nr:conserved rane protein of unknown function [Enterovirga sp.]
MNVRADAGSLSTSRTQDALKVSWEIAAFGAGLVLLAIVQLALGADALVLALSLSSIVIGFTPILAMGRDLYTVLCALFAFRYTGGALLVKVLYLQPIDQHLEDPLVAYGLVNLLMALEVGLILLARRLDRGRTIFPKLWRVEDLRVIGLICFLLGITAGAIVGVLGGRGDVEGVESGAAFVIAYALMSLLFLGFSAEVVATVRMTQGHEFVSRRVAMMLGLVVVLSLFLNARALVVNAVLCVFLAAFLLKAIAVRHLVVAGFAMYLFSAYLSPVALELRTVRDQMNASQFLDHALTTAVRAVTEPEYVAQLRAQENFRANYESGITTYDYFGDNFNIGNRLSYVALLDAVAAQTKVVAPLGLEPLDQVMERVKPSFFGDKEYFDYGYGDWLFWQLGMIEHGRIAFLNFALPMEGLALFGLPGFLLFPVVFMFPVLLLCGRISSLRFPSAPSLFLIGSLHWSLVEGTSDVFLSMPIRTIPLAVIPAYGLYWFWAQRRPI